MEYRRTASLIRGETCLRIDDQAAIFGCVPRRAALKDDVRFHYTSMLTRAERADLRLQGGRGLAAIKIKHRLWSDERSCSARQLPLLRISKPEDALLRTFPER